MSATGQPSEEELRAAYEAEIKKIRVEQILLEQLVTLINLGMRRTGLQPGTEDERDPGQVRVAIEGVRALLPLVEDGVGAEQTAAIRDALSQMQMAYVRIGGQDPGGPDAGAASPAGEPAPGASAAGPGGPGGPAPGGPPPGGAGEPGTAPPRPGEEPGAGPDQAGPAQRSGRLWIPGQR
ncbi:MAG TPA: hypothetical protein VGL69_14860 [Solirubrobacteraceae bacterium]|jgi:hypothetical protein